MWQRAVAFVFRLRDLFSRRRLEREADQEIEMHLDLLTAQYVRAGASPGEASRMARAKFGGVTQLKESLRDQMGFPMLESIVHDVRYAVRGLVRAKGFATVSVLMLALGLGVGTTFFTIASGWALRSLPFEDPDALVVLSETRPRLGRTRERVSAGSFQDWRRDARLFESVAVYSQVRFNVHFGRGRPERITGAHVSAELFPLLGIDPIRGRHFLPEEDRPAARRVGAAGRARQPRVVAAAVRGRPRRARAHGRPSGPSCHNLRIDGLEFTARIVDLHLPVDTALRAIDVGGPRRHFVVQRPEVADAAPAHALARHRAQFVLRDVQPAPVFRRVAELDATNQFPCPGRLEHLVEGSLGVRVEVVAHQGDLRAVGVASVQEAGDLQRPVHLRTPGPGGRLPPTRQRLAEQEDRGRAGPFVLVVDTPGTVLRGRHRRAGFLDQLHRLLVHAHDGTIRIVGFLIQIQDLFHVRHELGIGLRRDHPVLDFPPGHPVFFSVRRMVSWLIDSMIANSTTRRASRRNDQFA